MPTPRTRPANLRAGLFVRRRRLKLGLTRVALAFRLGMSTYRIIGLVESGRAAIPQGQETRWALALGVSPTTFRRTIRGQDV